MSSSAIPVLSDVLFYTPTDSYDVVTDNRPLFNLDTNIKAVATSLVGIGYGEHSAVNGGLLTPGKGVILDISTGQIKYPVGTDSDTTNPAILGLVVGATTAGLNKVIWGSQLLDLESVGLSGILSSPVAGSYLIINSTTGTIAAVDSAVEGSFILGKVENWPYISIKTVTKNEAAINATPSANHHNLYGFNRFRNLLMYLDMGQSPLQYQKVTKYQSDYSGGEINPMNCLLSADLSSIVPYSLSSLNISYDTSVMTSKVIKEKYYPFISNRTGASVSDSLWESVAYATTLTGNTKNYELESLGTSPDFSTSAGNTARFKNFYIEKYYQYAKVNAGSILTGKVTATATVFNPPTPGLQYDQYYGGESSVIIVWDFYEYNQTTGLEMNKYRIVTIGDSSSTLFNTETLIFNDTLKNL